MHNNSISPELTRKEPLYSPTPEQPRQVPVGQTQKDTLSRSNSIIKQQTLPTPGSKTTRLDDPLDTFILLSRAPGTLNHVPTVTVERNSLSHRLTIANKLFEYASGVSLVQHPLCQDCTDDLTVKLEKRLGGLVKERDAYAGYLEALSSDEPRPFLGESTSAVANKNSGQRDITEQDVLKLQEQESKALETLTDLETERDALNRELFDLEKELEEVVELEKRWVTVVFHCIKSLKNVHVPTPQTLARNQ